jgi:hypothetical protein
VKKIVVAIALKTSLLVLATTYVVVAGKLLSSNIALYINIAAIAEIGLRQNP